MSDFDVINSYIFISKNFFNLDLKLEKEHNLISGGTSCHTLGPR